MTIWILQQANILLIIVCTFLEADGAFIQSCHSENMYTISYGNGSWECVKCTRCPSGSRISQPCRYDRNTACETCPQETYVTGDASECRTCSRCQPGYYVDKQCSPVQNRVCKPCAVGYFSWKQNALYCQRCKHCRQGEKMRRLCTGRSNSVCSDCDNDHYREASTWRCVPCSECQDERSIRVQECIRKLGKNSNSVCQPQTALKNKDPSTTLYKIFHEHQEGPSTDVVMFTTLMVSTVVVFCSVFVCLILLIKPLQRACCRTRKGRFISLHNLTKTETVSLIEVNAQSELKQDSHSISSYSLDAHEMNLSVSNDKETESRSKVTETTIVLHECTNGSLLSDGEVFINEIKVEPKRVDWNIMKAAGKKRKRKLRNGLGGSDGDILWNNQFAQLENAKYTTI